jgi:arylsulfatase
MPDQLRHDYAYYTAAVGKMHFYPWDVRLGFQYRSIAEDKRWIHIRDDYSPHLREAGYRKYHGNEHQGYFEHKGAVICDCVTSVLDTCPATWDRN